MNFFDITSIFAGSMNIFFKKTWLKIKLYLCSLKLETFL